MNVHAFAADQASHPVPAASTGEIIIELVFRDDTPQPGVSCAENPDGKLARMALTRLVGKTKSIEFATENRNGPCAKAVRDLLTEILPQVPIQVVTMSSKKRSTPQDSVQSSSASDSVQVKVKASVGPSQSPHEQAPTPKTMVQAQDQGEPKASPKPIYPGAGNLVAVPGSQSNRFSRSAQVERQIKDSPAQQSSESDLPFKNRLDKQETSPTQHTFAPRSASPNQLSPRPPTQSGLFQSAPSQRKPYLLNQVERTDSISVSPGLSGLQKKPSEVGPLTNQQQISAGLNQASDATTSSSSDPAPKETSLDPTSQSKSVNELSQNSDWKSESLTFSFTAGLGQVSNTGDDAVRNGTAAGLQFAFRGLIERVRIILGAHGIWPDGGPVTQGIFFEGQFEYDLSPRRGERPHGFLLIGGVRGFAASTTAQSESVRRILPANESTPVLSNTLVVGAGHWSQLGPVRTLIALDLAPVLGSESFGVAVSGQLRSCYVLPFGMCAGVYIGHKDIQVGAKSGIAQFVHSSAGLALDLALD